MRIQVKALLGWAILCISLPAWSQEPIPVEVLLSTARELDCRQVAQSDSLLDILEAEAERHQQYGVWGEVLALRANNRHCEAQYQQAIALGRKGIAYLEQEKEYEKAGNLATLLSSCYRWLHNIDSAVWYSNYITQCAHRVESQALLVRSYLSLTGVYIASHEHDSSFHYALKALKLGEPIADSIDFFAGILHNVATAYVENGEPEKAREYYERAEVRYREDGFQAGLPTTIHIALGLNLTELEAYDEAIGAFERGIVHAEEIESDFMLAYLYRGLSKVYLLQDNTERAIATAELALARSEAIDLHGNTAVVLEILMSCYMQGGNYTRAIAYGEKGLTLTDDTHNLGIKKSMLEQLAVAYEATGQLQNSIQALREEKTLDIQMREEAKAQEFVRLQAQFDTEQKEAEIAALSQQAAIQSLEILQKNQLLILGALLVLFAATVIFFVVNQRVGRRKRAQTELEHRFLRSQLNPHFIFNALVSVQAYLFKNDTTQAAMYLTKFSKLMRQILENSRQEFIPLEQELSMLTNYLDLHQLRLSEPFEYSIELSDEIEATQEMIPPMFVQPFVENAIEHGILGLKGGGKIELYFKKQGDFIQIEVLDNGLGLNSKGDSEDSHRSLSTTIIKERMDLFNQSLHNKIQLVIGNQTDAQGQTKGTRIEMLVPYRVAIKSPT